MTDPINRLKTALSDRYVIERELGAGGMATVYLAEDLKHHRQVAIKVLRPELAATLGADRFVREIEIAANLTHPHILPLFDSGSVEDPTAILYYVMPYVEGETLRDRVNREGQLPVDDALQISKEVAAALSYAHSHDVIHRDIKPENVLLSAGEAVVADFGIARAITEAGGEHLTETGISIGTPAYMSPEQASGAHKLDGRSDVYSLGCVLYEMLAGEPPYTGPTAQAVLAKKLSEPTPRVSVIRERVAPSIEAAIDQALAKAPADRFGTASAFAEALTTEMAVARVDKLRWTRLAVAAPVTILVVAAAIWGYVTFLGGPAYERLAVLPPVNLMNDPEQEYFVAGMHNALISELQRAGIAVIARTSVLRYENTQMSIREIASELGADALIESSVLRSGENVEIEVRLVDGGTEQYLADPIARSSELRDVVVLYRELTSAVASEIRAALTPQAEAVLGSARPVNPQAYDAYLRGQFHFGNMTLPDRETALHYYEQALEYDPDYALAHAGIALVWVARSQFGSVRPRDALPHITAAVERAMQLDSTLVEVQSVLAIVRTCDLWDWAGAEAAFQRAIEINPNYPDVRSFYSQFLLSMKRLDEAMRQSQLAVELDPFNPITQSFHGQVLCQVGRYDEAIAQFERLLRNVPNHPIAYSGLVDVYAAMGMRDEEVAAAVAEHSALGRTEVAEALALFYAEGDYREARLRVADMWAGRASATYVSPWSIAWQYAAAEEDSLALDWLERGVEERDPNMPYLAVHPGFGRLRDDPRFQALLQRMGLPQ